MNRNSVIIRVADTYHKLAEVWYIISKIMLKNVDKLLTECYNKRQVRIFLAFLRGVLL